MPTGSMICFKKENELRRATISFEGDCKQAMIYDKFIKDMEQNINQEFPNSRIAILRYEIGTNGKCVRGDEIYGPLSDMKQKAVLAKLAEFSKRHQLECQLP